MKNLKQILATAILFLGLQSVAQNPNSDGVYSSTFGTITLTTEYGSEFPGGYGITYGDYKDKGTITGDIIGEEIKGTFYNGAEEGKFIFFPKNKGFFEKSFDKEVTGLDGYWGYNSDNKYSSNPKDKWDGNRTKKGFQAIQNVTNVWSGKWNTTFGPIYLNQVASRIVGTYKSVNTIKAKYDPSTRLLKGTFTNDNLNQKGYFQFFFEGNTFVGKWGWTTAMTEGKWDGTKAVKNNKELSKAVASTPAQNSSSTAQNTTNTGTTKYIVKAVKIESSNSDNYGFFGCKLYKVTQNGRELVNSFGNKEANFQNTTENSSNLLGKNENLPNSPTYFREYNLNNADLNNKNIKFELELYMHMKAKTAGTNMNYGYKKEVFRLDQVKLDDNITIKSFANGVTIFGSGGCFLSFKVNKN